jgi:hypothetical protein
MLTQSQLDAFHRDGFLIMSGLFAGRELALLQEQSALVVAAGIARQGEHHLYLPKAGAGGENPNVPASDSSTYWRSERMFQRHAIFRAAATQPELLENIGQCIGQGFFPWNHSLVVKIPGGPAVTWHQDPYFPKPSDTTPPVPNFTADIYLDESDEGNGCVWAIPGHHLIGDVTLQDKTARTLIDRCGAIPLRMRPGDVIFHALTTPHGSLENPSNRMRRTYYLHFLAQEAFNDAGYHRWSADNPSWGPEKIRQIHAFAQDRKDLGLAPTFGGALAIADDGIRVASEVTTPRHHWAALAAKIPAEQRARLRALVPAESEALAAAAR